MDNRYKSIYAEFWMHISHVPPPFAACNDSRRYTVGMIKLTIRLLK